MENERNESVTTVSVNHGKGLLALSPIIVFLLLYVAVSAAIGDFYKMPLSIAFIVAAVWGMATMPRMRVAERIEVFSTGAANSNILYMIWIFIMAGAFSALANGIGAIDATVDLALHVLPKWFMLPGLFLTACFISMSIGTSVGTVVALTPFAVQLASVTGGNVPFYVSVALGGSFFGDNLSFISDTTIAATRNMRVKMNDKFKANLWIALPAALVTLAVYAAIGGAAHAAPYVPQATAQWQLVIPYLVVIALAMTGINVLVVLSVGIACCLTLAAAGGHQLIDLCTAMGGGIKDMSDLIIVTLLAAGLLEVISFNGGISYIIRLLTKRIHGKRGAQTVIALLVGLVNVCTANNTIAIITVGKIARQVALMFGLDARKVASLLDTCSCIVQCIIPYGAQTLLAAGLAKVSPVAFLPYLYYAWALAAAVALSIVLGFPRQRPATGTCHPECEAEGLNDGFKA